MSEVCIIDSAKLSGKYNMEALAKAASAFICVPERFGELYCNLLSDSQLPEEKLSRYLTVDVEHIVVSYDCLRLDATNNHVKVFAHMEVVRTALGNIFKSQERFDVEYFPRIYAQGSDLVIVAVDVTFTRKPETK